MTEFSKREIAPLLDRLDALTEEDELVETVIAKGGQVIFADDGTLTRHQRIALIMRY
jgi:hypothetical protein